jgi:hypothetical protein
MAFMASITPARPRLSEPGAADLKSLHRKRLARPRDFKSMSGTRIISVLVPPDFPKFASGLARCLANFGKGGTGGNKCDQLATI